MTKKTKKKTRKGIRPPKKPKGTLICPNCLKKKKGIAIDNYILCFYCGLVIYKPPGSLEQINAPGFIIKPRKSKEKNRTKQKEKTE